MIDFEKMQLIQQRRVGGDKRSADRILREIEADYEAIRESAPDAKDTVGYQIENGKRYRILGDGSRRVVAE